MFKLLKHHLFALAAFGLPALGCSTASSDAATDAATPPCNEQNPAMLAHYDAARGCFEDPAPVPGVCLSNLELKDNAGLGVIECAFDEKGAVYAFVAIEGQWLTGAGFHVINDAPAGPTPADETATTVEADQCGAISCAHDCATGKVSYSEVPCAVAAPGDAGPSDAARD